MFLLPLIGGQGNGTHVEDSNAPPGLVWRKPPVHSAGNLPVHCPLGAERQNE